MAGLSPADAAVAVRSFPRRFRGLLDHPDADREPDRGGGDDADPDEVARRIGPDGTSAVDHLLAADGVLTLVDRALEQARTEPDPVLHPATADLAGATWDDPHSSLADLLDQLEATADALVRRVEAIPTDAWGERLRIAGHDGDASVLSVLTDGVDVVAAHLRAAEAVVRAVR